MSQPTETSLRVPHERLHTFVHDAARRSGMPEAHASLLADLLIANDLRGVSSHGCAQIHRYVNEIAQGGVNPTPDVQLVHETANSLVMDGDGGLGYFPAYEGALKLIEKAEAQGMAAMVTRRHGHIGGAGLYTRLALPHDLMAFVTSGVQLGLKPDSTVFAAGGASPMSFAAPTATEPALVFDCGVTHGIQGGQSTTRDQLLEVAPGVVRRMLGFGTVCQSWGGLLAGLPVDEARADRRYTLANQGAMMFAFKVSLFTDVDVFKQEMDTYVRRVRELEPMPGTTAAHLPGDVEAVREREHRADGVPISEGLQRRLRRVADQLDLALPWA